MNLDDLRNIGYSILDAKLSELHGDEDSNVKEMSNGIFSTVIDICAQMIIAYENSKNE